MNSIWKLVCIPTVSYDQHKKNGWVNQTYKRYHKNGISFILIIKFKLRLKYYSSSSQMILKQFNKKMTEASLWNRHASESFGIGFIPAVSTITYFISPAPLTDVPVSTDILSIKSNLSYFLLKRINLDIYKSFHNSISAKATIILQQQRLPSTYSCLSLPTILKRSNFPPSEFSQGKIRFETKAEIG